MPTISSRPTNQTELWLAFARRGFGRSAASTSTTGNPQFNQNESDPMPDFEAPLRQRDGHFVAPVQTIATPRLTTRASTWATTRRASSPIADTNPATNAPPTALHNNLDDQSHFAPGTYEFVAHAPGYGAVRFREEIRAGQFGTIRLDMAPNVASRSQGATARRATPRQ